MHSLELHNLILHMKITILLCLHQAGGNERNMLQKWEIRNNKKRI